MSDAKTKKSSRYDALMRDDLGTRPFEFERTKRDGTKETISVRLRHLTKREVDNARDSALVSVKRRLAQIAEQAEVPAPELASGALYEEKLIEARAREVLSLALRDPEDDTALLFTPNELDEKFTLNEFQVLFNAYEQFEQDSGPNLRGITPEQMSAIIEDLSEGAGENFFSLCESYTLRACMRSMAVELTNWRTGKLSLTSPSSSTTGASERSVSPTPGTTQSAPNEAIADLQAQIEFLTERLDQLEFKRTASEG